MPPRQQHHRPRGIRGAYLFNRFTPKLFSVPVILVGLFYAAQTLLPGDRARIAEARERRLRREQEKIESTRWQELRAVEQDQDQHQAAQEENRRWR